MLTWLNIIPSSSLVLCSDVISINKLDRINPMPDNFNTFVLFKITFYEKFEV